MDKSIYGRLKRLFSTNVIVRRIGKDQLRVIDSNQIQSTGNIHNSRFIDRFTRLHGIKPHSLSNGNPNYNYFSSKTELYSDYEVMDQDSIISSALDIYADETVMKDERGEILSIKSEDDNIKKILHNLFYDILNVDFNLWPWVRNMCKYGDMYLHLDVEEEIGVVNVTPMSAYEVIREEGLDPNNPYSVSFKLVGTQGAKMENYEIAHFRNLTDSNFLPYGKSLLEGARKVWKQLILMEDAMLIHRVMRAPEKRIFKVDVGNIPANEVDAYMQRIINQMKKVPYVDPATGDYNLKFNMANMLEDYFLPVRGGQSSTEIDTLAGMEFTGIEDIEYLRNRMLAALKVPKAFLGYEEGISGKATLAAEDIRFARTVERIQRTVISELTKIAIVHLYAQGYENADLAKFEITMTSPSVIYEQEKITLWNSKVDLAGSIAEKELLSREWVFKNIFNFTEDEIKEVESQLITDKKSEFRKTKIKEEGEDPANPVPKKKEEEGEKEEGGEEEEKTGNPFESVDVGGAPPGGQPGAGRPKEPMKYNTQKHPRGYDPLGNRAMRNAYKHNGLSNESIDLSLKRLNLEKFKINAKILKESSANMLDDNNIIEEEL